MHTTTVSFRNLGRVEQTISAYYGGRVHFRATSWPARLSQPLSQHQIPAGSLVNVIGQEGITLLVAPFHENPMDMAKSDENAAMVAYV